MSDNILYQNDSAGIIICLHVDKSIETLMLHGDYPIILRRSTLGIRFRPVKTMPKHPWQHQIIMNTFDKIGWPVKITANGKYYSLKHKKDRFRFKLKYGK